MCAVENDARIHLNQRDIEIVGFVNGQFSLNSVQQTQVYNNRSEQVPVMVLRFNRGIVLSSILSMFFAFNASSTLAADFTTAAYRLAVAEAAQDDKDLAAFYQDYGYQPL